MRDYIAEGVCPDSEDPRGFDTCTVCGTEADGVYDDDAFVCAACCMHQAEQAYDPRWEHDSEPENGEMPF